jgi:integrase
MVSTSLMVDTSSHPRAQLHRCVERSAYEANRLKHAYVHTFKQRIAALKGRKGRGQKQAELDDLYAKAIAWRQAFEKHKGEILFEDAEGRPTYVTDEFLSQVADEAKEFAETYGEQAADEFFAIAKGEKTPLKDQIEPWLTEEAGLLKAQTIVQHRTVLNAFLEWAGEAVSIESVTKRKAGEYVTHLLSSSGLSRKTVQRYVSSLSSLWVRLEARGLAAANPWRGQGLSRKSKHAKGVTGRKQWSDEALVKVLTGEYSSHYLTTLHDLAKLALVTGARLDELCALKADDVQERADGWWMSIPEGKTQAAVRDVPVHDSVAHVLARRKRTARTYLFEGLIPGGPDKKRSWNISKVFGHYTHHLDLGEDRRVFHAIRNTFTEAMEGAEVPESTVKLLIGHARGSMTYGRYSKGKRVQLREAIDKLNYSSKLMQVIRTPIDEQKHTPKRQKDAGKSKKSLKRKNAGA